MDLKIYRINEEGVAMIRQFLLDNHKRPQEETSASGMARWLMEAEVCVDISEGIVVLEIPAEDCVHGHAVEYRLDDSGIDVELLQDI